MTQAWHCCTPPHRINTRELALGTDTNRRNSARAYGCRALSAIGTVVAIVATHRLTGGKGFGRLFDCQGLAHLDLA